MPRAAIYTLILIMKIPTVEYMAHKAFYDATYYASSLSHNPSYVVLRTRTRHAGNQPDTPQCHCLTVISRKASRIIREQGPGYIGYKLAYEEHKRRQRLLHRNPLVYEVPSRHKTYSCSTLYRFICCCLRERIPVDMFT